MYMKVIDISMGLAYTFHVEHAVWSRNLLAAGAAELEISLTQDAISQLYSYASELQAWNRKMNLTGPTSEEEIVVKHFLDSLIYTQYLPDQISESLLDVGTGAGFPGLPLKIVRPALAVTLLEPSEKKTAFLHHMIGTLGLEKIVVVSRRVQEFIRDPGNLARFRHVVTRAVNVAELLPSISRLLVPGGRLVLWRTQPLESLPQQSRLVMLKDIGYRLPRGHGQRRLVILGTQGAKAVI
jgi:16S rRNA (guanine527-N7)-methyltransferase